MVMDEQVEIAGVHLRKRRRVGSTTSDKDLHSDFVTLGMWS
jgi:hypothetical protein